MANSLEKIKLPTDWKCATLEELCVRPGEYGAGIAKRDYDPSLPRYIRITDIRDDGFLHSINPVSISEEDARPYVMKEGDIVFARSGATVGKTYLYNKDDGRCAFAGYLIKFQPNPNVIVAEFLKYFVQSKFYWKWVKNSQQTLAQPNINAKQYGSLNVPVPPLPEQKKIAEILSSVDEAIASTQAVIDQTRKVKQGLLQQLLTHGIGHTRFKESAIGEIPEEWNCVTLGELLDRGDLLGIQDGNHGEKHPKASDYVSEGVPFIMARDLVNGSVDTTSCAFITQKQADSLRIGFSKPGDVLLTHKGTIGTVAITPYDFDYIMLTPQVTYYRVNFQGELLSHFLVQLFLSPEFQKQLSRVSTQSTRNYIGITAQKKLLIPFPPKDEQQKILDILESNDLAERLQLNEMKRLKNLKQGLMQDLL